MRKANAGNVIWVPFSPNLSGPFGPTLADFSPLKSEQNWKQGTSCFTSLDSRVPLFQFLHSNWRYVTTTIINTFPFNHPHTVTVTCIYIYIPHFPKTLIHLINKINTTMTTIRGGNRGHSPNFKQETINHRLK